MDGSGDGGAGRLHGAPPQDAAGQGQPTPRPAAVPHRLPLRAAADRKQARPRRLPADWPQGHLGRAKPSGGQCVSRVRAGQTSEPKRMNNEY